ncbi:protein BIG GRAIN 1-like [Elaeis guineensis]|uniref:Protein BIG GRAIN 1-like n=1 Tax=Elaeis guineensis var. tenera TaxID=51953 RepID=A0A6I9S3F3_ELAGV|nr:protein BIG GRAIN 1-like [Elaeis guineensis]
MERWAKPPVRRGNDHPSFSSTLLDAIYRSIDEADSGAAREHRTGGALDRRDGPVLAAAKKQQSFTDQWPAERRRSAAVSERAVTRLRKPENRPGFPVNSTSSSSDCSSYGGFSSSEAESVPRPAGLRPIRTGGLLYRSERARSNPPPPQPPAVGSPSAHHHQEKKKSSSIRSKFRDLRKAKAPASPGARLASFLNSLFTATGNSRKSKSAATVAAYGGVGVRGGEESACSTATSYSRSCLSKTPSSRGRPPLAAGEGVKRSVRFYPVSVIVDEDCRPCGQKCLYDGDSAAVARRPPEAAAMAKKRVEELLRGFEEEEDEEGSDSSSDLFELENLTAIGGRGYRDELPVYETTHLGTNRAISHGFFL